MVMFALAMAFRRHLLFTKSYTLDCVAIEKICAQSMKIEETGLLLIVGSTFAACHIISTEEWAISISCGQYQL